MARKPTYIDTLNHLAVTERAGYHLFRKWADTTDDAALKPVLETVCIREMEHSWAFEKRLSELGYAVQDVPVPKYRKTLRLMGSSEDDEQKFAAFGVGHNPEFVEEGFKQLVALLEDRTIDPQTGALLGRFICEERDSGRLLEKAYRAQKRRKNKK